MLFTSDYSMKMPIGEALLTSLVGIVTVLIILAFIAGMIILVSKMIRTLESASAKKKVADAPAEDAKSAPQGVPMPEGMNQGELQLIGTDEKTAAIIMAIVSDKSGIPLNRLSFKSIKLMEDKK